MGTGAEVDVLPYLCHLDGLRTLALMGVLGFHFKIPGLQGGFLGVDCFLVLSGYLMTRIVSSGIASEKFKLGEFYVSRFWRLFPSVIVTSASCVALAFLLFRPIPALDVCKSALAATGSVSNLYFYSVSGYFDTSANIKPLLHTWSLSMEEQFYLVWPPVLLLFTKTFRSKPRRWEPFVSFILAMSALSVLFSVSRNASRSKSFDFFFLPSRLFEFGAGALTHALTRADSLSVFKNSQVPVSHESSKEIGSPKGLRAHLLVEVGACAGFSLIFLSYSKIPPGSPIYYGIPAVLGTALLIRTETAKINQTVLCNLLSRSMGKLAYAIYLVHWPIYVYFRYAARAMKIHVLETPIALFLSSLFCGAVLHVFVERKFRLKRGDQVSKLNLMWVLAMTVATVSSAWSGVTSNGWAFRGVPNVKAVPEKYAVPPHSMGITIGSDYHAGGGSTLKVVGKDLDQKRYKKRLNFSDFSIMVIGNSFVNALTPAFYKAHDKEDMPLLLNSKPGCPLFPPLKVPLKKPKYDCTMAREAIWKNVRSMPKNSTIFVANNFGGYGGYHETGETQANGISKAIKLLGHTPYVLGPPAGISNIDEFNACMDFLYMVEYWKRSSLTKATKARCNKLVQPKPAFIKAEKSITAAIEKGKASFGYLSSIQKFCMPESPKEKYSCLSTVDVGQSTKPFYNRDGFHVSFYGAVEHVPIFQPLVKSSNRRRVE